MLDLMITWMTDVLHAVAYQPVPNPGQGEAPPFAEQVETLLGWAMWGALFCCVAGFIIIGARMGIQHKRGEGGNHMGSMAMVGFACILIMTAYTIVRQLAGAAG